MAPGAVLKIPESGSGPPPSLGFPEVVYLPEVQGAPSSPIVQETESPGRSPRAGHGPSLSLEKLFEPPSPRAASYGGPRLEGPALPRREEPTNEARAFGIGVIDQIEGPVADHERSKNCVPDCGLVPPGDGDWVDQDHEKSDEDPKSKLKELETSSSMATEASFGGLQDPMREGLQKLL